MNDPVSTPFEYSGIENLEAMKHAHKYNAFLVELLRSNLKGKSVIDFGAGAGTFAEPMRESGFEVACIEPDTDLCNALGSKGFTSYTSIADAAAASADSIYTLNVLEHIADDDAALSQLTACLRPGGRLVIYVPAFQVLYSSMDRLVGHHRRYRRNGLVAQLRAAGLQINTAHYVDSLGFAAALAYRVIGGDKGVISPGSVRFYDRWLFPLSRLLDRITFGSVGKNLLVVATRPGTAKKGLPN